MTKLIVARNPARKSRKRRTAAQKAATRKMIAANRRRSRGSTTRRKRRRNPAPTARRRVSRVYSNPKRRRRASGRRRNPVKVAGLVNRSIMPALIGGAGAVANDVLYNFLPLPPMLQTGTMRHVGKAASALALAWASSFFLTRKQADQIGAGALTVVGYNVVRELVGRFAPQVQMGEYLSPGMGWYGAGLNPGMGEYLQPSLAAIPGAGVTTGAQLTQGTPYLDGLADYEGASAYEDY